MPRGSAGTNRRKAMDVRRVTEALKARGIDTRHWVSYATVGTVGDDGKFDPTDDGAVFIDKAGVEVDVLLEPLNIACTCLYTGIQGGDRVSIFSSIKPGDRVLVTLPDGDLIGPPTIQAILHSAHNQMPSGPDSGDLPIFQNDRLLIYSNGQDVDVRAIGADITHIADNTRTGGRDAANPLVLGDVRNARWERLYQQLVAHKHGTAVGPTSSPLAPELTDWTTEPQTLGDDISDNNFTKKTNDGN